MSEPRWWVDCRDPFGRDRAMTVLVEPDRVVLVAPPGETAVLSPQQTRRLHLALDRAAGSLRQTDVGPTELDPGRADTGLAQASRTDVGLAE
ncbi:hypothetical protein [Kutzneria sp. CA-103260]|uniref:hypothetical protein n=1 Tax=Kutzneria sp. CA-103260 TaxID=2802641 RepID=UPI001BADE266|nr:hypothetical protein [Kutzneria sp. CA-103260]QUQ71021.1 hypothetical protein JJ691_88040 [Kutzneria sp. CA-103260]